MDTTRRGVDHPRDVGDVRLLFRAGVDSPNNVPVYNLTAGELFAYNTGDQPVELRYDASDTFVHAFLFKFGVNQQESFSYARHGAPHSTVKVMLEPKERLLLGRMDFMWLVGEVSPKRLLDGVVTTYYSTVVNIGPHSELLKIGPHPFRVGLARDWDAEFKAYHKLFDAT